MEPKLLTGYVMAGALLTAMGCAPIAVTPLPQTVRRVAVLPAYQHGGTDADVIGPNGLAGPPSRTIADLLAQQARVRLAAKGFDVVSAGAVKAAIKDRVPSSAQMAAQMLREANLDAAGLYIEVRRWEPTPNSRGLKADGVIVALDAVMIDPKTGAILWQVHRPSRPVPVYGVVLTGQANVFVAETVIREIFP